MMMVAHISRIELAAGALSLSTFIGIMTISSTIFYSVGILISHSRGKKQGNSEIGKIVRNGFWLALLLFVPTSLALWNADKMLTLFGEDPALVAISRGYFHYAIPAMLPLLFMTVIIQFYSAIGRPHFSTVISILTLPVTLSASYCFVLGNFGFPQMGLAGISCAWLVAQTTMMTAALSYMILSKDLKKYAVFSSELRPDWATCKSIFKLGMPIGLQFGGEIAAMAASTYLLGHFGVIALSSAQVVSQYILFVVMIELGITQALSLLTSEAYGEMNYTKIKDYLDASMILLMICFAVVLLFFVEMPEVLVRLFLDKDLITPELLYISKALFKVSCLMVLIDGIRNIYTGSLRGLHDSKLPMRIGIASLWLVSLPVAYLAGFTLNGGPIGQRAGFISGFAVSAALLWFRLRKKLTAVESELQQPMEDITNGSYAEQAATTK